MDSVRKSIVIFCRSFKGWYWYSTLLVLVWWSPMITCSCIEPDQYSGGPNEGYLHTVLNQGSIAACQSRTLPRLGDLPCKENGLQVGTKETLAPPLSSVEINQQYHICGICWMSPKHPMIDSRRQLKLLPGVPQPGQARH